MRKLLLILATLSVLLLQPATASDFQFTSTPNTQVEKNTEYTYDVSFANPNNRNLTLSLAEKPTGMIIDNTTVSWTPVNTGNYSVSLQLSEDANTSHSINQNYTVEVTTTPGEFSADTLQIGGPNQERDNTITTTYTVENTGIEPIQNLNVTFENVPNRYDIQANPPSTIQGGNEAQLDITTTIPLDQNAGETDIGNIVLEGTTQGQQITQRNDILLEVENNLEINRIDVRVDGRRERFDASGGRVDDELDLDSTVEITTTVENTYEDEELDDIEIETISDLDSADGLVDSISSLRTDRDGDLVIDFEIDEDDFVDLRDDEFEIDAELKAESEEGARHERDFRLEFEFDRQQRDVRITNVNSNPTGRVRCVNNNLRLDVRLLNVGTRDLDDIFLRSEIPEYDITERRSEIELFEGEQRTETLNLNLPEEREGGSFLVETFVRPRRTDDDTDENVFTLRFDECPEDDGNTGTPGDDDGQTPGNDTDGGDAVVRPPAQPGEPVPVDSSEGEAPFGMSEDTYLAVLIVLVGVLLVIFLSLLVVVSRD